MQNETILCVAPRDWYGLWKEAQSIMSRIAERNRVLYFDPGRDSNQSAISELVDNLPNFFRLRTRQVTNNLTVIPTPSCLPHVRQYLPRSVLQVTMPLVVKANAQILIQFIQHAVKMLNVESPILWLYSPYHGDLIGKFDEKLVCYYNYDEFADYISNTRVKEIIRYYEAQLCSKVDVIFTTSRAQCKVRKTYNSQTYFVPNAVDFELFNRALTPGIKTPEDIVKIPHPIIGYAGRMAAQIDIKLLCRIAEAYPSSSLVLVGPDELPHNKDEKALRALNNVYFLGWKAPSDLPNYLQAFDAALIPYQLVGHVLSGYPTKLHEYLAAGRSVVATAMPELLPYRNVLRIGQTHEEMVSLVSEAVEDKSSRAIEARVSVAHENTWENRVAEIYRILQPMLSEKMV